jgi:hypothetical protein
MQIDIERGQRKAGKTDVIRVGVSGNTVWAERDGAKRERTF